MTGGEREQLGRTLWTIADQLRGAMNADDFRDYMLAFLFLRYLSDNYEQSARKELGRDYPDRKGAGGRSALSVWYEQNEEDVPAFERQMRLKAHYVVRPEHLWTSVAHKARTQDGELLDTLQAAFKYVENESFHRTFSGLFSEINLGSEKLGRSYAERNGKLCAIISKIAEGLAEFSSDVDALGDAYEYLISQFAAGSGKKAGEFYTPQRISDILSAIITLDGQAPETGRRRHLDSVLDFACGSGSLLLSVRKRMGPHGIGKIFGQEKNITTYNLARMNMLLHGVKDTEFEIHHGDTLTNDWEALRDANPAKRPRFDAVVANPPFSYRWDPTEASKQDARFKNHGVAPKSAADFAFLLHGFYYLKDDGVMAIILPHGVLFRGGAEARMRRKLLDDGNIDAIIGLPPNLFYSTGIPVCVLVLKKCKRHRDVLFINAAEDFVKGKRQNHLSDRNIERIVETYQSRPHAVERYARRVGMEEIAACDFNLSVSRYVSTADDDVAIDLASMHDELVEVEKRISESTSRHNAFLKELGLPQLPVAGDRSSPRR